MAGSSQKFIARNRAPRVQIEYDVELYGAEKKVQLPFVMGVMSDLAGKSEVPQPAVGDRKFLEIDVDNFDERMRAMKPRAAFTVPNTLSGEGNLSVDLTFEKMDDFTPGAIAAKIEPLRQLLEARTQLSNLMTYMDGKTGAETLIEKILADPAMLAAISGGAGAGTDPSAALDSLRELAPDDAPAEDTGDQVLDALRAAAPEDVAETDTSADVLAGLKDAAPTETPVDDTADKALDALRDAAPADQTPEEDTSADVLAGLKDSAPVETETPDIAQALQDAIGGMAVPDEAPAEDNSGVLDALRDAAPTEVAEDDGVETALQNLAELAPGEDADQTDTATSDALSSLADAAPDEVADDTSVDDALSALAEAAPEDTKEDESADTALDSLAALATDQDEVVDTSVDDALSALADAAPEEDTDDDVADDVLSGLADLAVDADDATDTAVDDALSALAEAAPEDTEEDESADTALDSLAALATGQDDVVDTSVDDALSALADVAPDEDTDDDVSDDVLSGLADLAVEADDATDTAVDDALSALADAAPEEDTSDDVADDVLSGLAELDIASDLPEDDSVDDALADLPTEETAEDDQTDAALDSLADLTVEEPEQTSVDDALDALSELTPPEEAEDSVDDILGDLLGDDDADETPESPASDDLDALLGDTPDDSDLDDLLGDLEADQDDDQDDVLADTSDDASEDSDSSDLDDLLGDLETEDDGGLDDLLAGLGDEDDSDLDDLLTDDAAEEPDDDGEADAVGDDLDALLGDLGLDDDPADAGVGDDMDELTAELSNMDSDAATGALNPETAGADLSGEADVVFGQLSQSRPDAARLNRKRFRIAILGDFTGRSARGMLDTGDALAARAAIVLDPDTVEDVIEGFATTLILPIGKDGAGVEVKLGGLDDLHPDELYDNVELFSALVSLKGQLSSGATAAHALTQLKAWGAEHGRPIAPPSRRSSGNAVPADRKLSDFQKLIGDTGGRLTEASPIDDLLARVVGPHVRAVPDADAQAMQDAVDEALSAAMRLVLHHPEFQSVEAQWRSLDLIARSVEVDDTLEVVLYDVSAEEIGADLASAEDLSDSGLLRLLTEGPLDEETGRGGYSALIGLYNFEETPPHADLLGRIGRVAAHIDAPFFSSISPAFLDTPKDERHPLVADAWDSLRKMPEAGHLGVVSPRFMLRRPYGAKSEPIYAFKFEEFTMSEGMRGLLWANPVVLVAILLAKSFKENGPSMGLGKIMSLGDIPFHYVTDQFGDQVALPCTERNLTLEKVEQVMVRGYMPVVSIKGRDEIRLASFQSMAGPEILGPWTGVAPPEPSPPKEPPTPKPAAEDADAGDADSDGDLDLDDLLAGFGDDDGDGGDADSEDVDAELAALLGDL